MGVKKKLGGTEGVTVTTIWDRRSLSNNISRERSFLEYHTIEIMITYIKITPKCDIKERKMLNNKLNKFRYPRKSTTLDIRYRAEIKSTIDQAKEEENYLV